MESQNKREPSSLVNIQVMYVMFTGTAFALTSVVEALTPIAASPLYTFVYNETLQTFSGAFYILSSAFYALDVILMRFVVAYGNFFYVLFNC